MFTREDITTLCFEVLAHYLDEDDDLIPERLETLMNLIKLIDARAE